MTSTKGMFQVLIPILLTLTLSWATSQLLTHWPLVLIVAPQTGVLKAAIRGVAPAIVPGIAGTFPPPLSE